MVADLPMKEFRVISAEHFVNLCVDLRGAVELFNEPSEHDRVYRILVLLEIGESVYFNNEDYTIERTA